MAMPASDARSGTPELYRDRVEAQTEPIEVEPLEPRASDTWRMAYGNSSRFGSTGAMARSASAPCPISRRFGDRKSTRLNSSHVAISYAVFCLKKKTKNPATTAKRQPP